MERFTHGFFKVIEIFLKSNSIPISTRDDLKRVLAFKTMPSTITSKEFLKTNLHLLFTKLEVHSHITRNRTKLIIPQHRLEKT